MAVRFSGLCGTVIMPMGFPAGRPIAGVASAVTAETTREKGSYDRFAEGYDDLDGGWAASVLGIEVRECVLKPRRVIITFSSTHSGLISSFM